MSAAILANGGTVLLAPQPLTTAPVTAVLLGLAVAVAAGAVLLRVRGRRAQGAEALEPAVIAGALLVLALAGVDHGAVLSWTFGVEGETGRVVLRGVGVPLGAALLLALGGVLVLTSARLAPEGSGARPVGVGALWGAVIAGVLGVVLALLHVVALSEGLGPGGARSPALLVAAVGTLAVCLREGSGPVSSGSNALLVRAARLNHVAAALALAAAVAAGAESWWREAAYASPLTAAAAATALLGLAALRSEAPLAGTRRLLFLLALLFLLVA
jgi:hypothetical protein